MLVVSAIVAVAAIGAVLFAQANHLARTEPDRMARAEFQRARLAAATRASVASGSRDPMGRAVDVLRRHPWARRGLSFGSGVAMVVAVGMIGYPFYTNLVQQRIQSRLDRQLASDELRDAYVERRVQEGDSLTRIRISDIDVSVVVVEGTGAEALRAGAGHYKSTPLPCENGNVAIAGHRTTYGRPFHNLDLLDPGDEITVETPIGLCRYRVNPVPEGRRALDERNGAFIVAPSEVSVVANTSTPVLTLTTCHPKGSAAERLIIQASLVTEATPGSSGPGGT